MPLLTLGLLEFGLRAFGYGYPTEFFVAQADSFCYETNRWFGRRFADPAIAPKPHPVILAGSKAPGTYRIVLLGESAALGTPDPAYGLGRVLEMLLSHRHPDIHFELVTAAVTGINSHVVLPIARDCARLQPDLFVVYMGNNEAIGPYGLATVFHGYSPSLALIRGSVWAKRWRVGQLGESLLRPAKIDAPTEWAGMEMFAAHRVPPDDPRRQTICDHFAANLSDIIATGTEARAGVVVCTVGANLADCPPFASEHRAGLADAERRKWDSLYQEAVTLEDGGKPAAAAEKYVAAAAIDDRYADLHYRLAKCCLTLGRIDDARRHFIHACDFDALQFRIDSRLNEIIRTAAGGRESERVYLADVEWALQQDPRSVHGLTGDGLFWEHVHLRFAGNDLAARAILPAAEAALGLTPAAKAALPTPAECAARLALTPYDEYRCATSMVSMMSRPPFTGQLDHARRQAARVETLVTQVPNPEALETSRQMYATAIARRPDDWQIRFNFAPLLLLVGRPAEAAEQAAAVADAVPGNPAAQALLADTLLASGRTEEAVVRYRAALTADPFLGRAHKGLGDALAASGQPADALAEYDAAIRRNPADADALSNRGKVRLAVGSVAAARADFTTALAVRPDAEAELQLGTLTLKEGKPAEALPHFERASRLNPGDARMENNCGAALLALGRLEDAERRFRAALSADPNHAKAHAALGQVLMGRGLAADAIAHFRTAIALKNDGPATLSALAWLLATAADPKLRDGAEAVRLAEQACRQTGGRDPSCLDALSVSYACIGRFDDAVRTARAAADIADATGAAQQAALIRRRISALEAGRPPYP